MLYIVIYVMISLLDIIGTTVVVIFLWGDMSGLVLRDLQLQIPLAFSCFPKYRKHPWRVCAVPTYPITAYHQNMRIGRCAYHGGRLCL